MEKRLIDFSDLDGMQDRSLAFALNNHKAWANEEYAYLAANMFDLSIEQLAKHLGRTASSVATVFNKDEAFIEIREANGAVISLRNRSGVDEVVNGRDNRVVTSDVDILFNFSD